MGGCCSKCETKPSPGAPPSKGNSSATEMNDQADDENLHTAVASREVSGIAESKASRAGELPSGQLHSLESTIAPVNTAAAIGERSPRSRTDLFPPGESEALGVRAGEAKYAGVGISPSEETAELYTACSSPATPGREALQLAAHARGLTLPTVPLVDEGTSLNITTSEVFFTPVEDDTLSMASGVWSNVPHGYDYYNSTAPTRSTPAGASTPTPFKRMASGSMTVTSVRDNKVMLLRGSGNGSFHTTLSTRSLESDAPIPEEMFHSCRSSASTVVLSSGPAAARTARSADAPTPFMPPPLPLAPLPRAGATPLGSARSNHQHAGFPARRSPGAMATTPLRPASGGNQSTFDDDATSMAAAFYSCRSADTTSVASSAFGGGEVAMKRVPGPGTAAPTAAAARTAADNPLMDAPQNRVTTGLRPMVTTRQTTASSFAPSGVSASSSMFHSIAEAPEDDFGYTAPNDSSVGITVSEEPVKDSLGSSGFKREDRSREPFTELVPPLQDAPPSAVSTFTLEDSNTDCSFKTAASAATKSMATGARQPQRQSSATSAASRDGSHSAMRSADTVSSAAQLSPRNPAGSSAYPQRTAVHAMVEGRAGGSRSRARRASSASSRASRSSARAPIQSRGTSVASASTASTARRQVRSSVTASSKPERGQPELDHIISATEPSRSEANVYPVEPIAEPAPREPTTVEDMFTSADGSQHNSNANDEEERASTELLYENLTTSSSEEEMEIVHAEF